MAKKFKTKGYNSKSVKDIFKIVASIERFWGWAIE